MTSTDSFTREDIVEQRGRRPSVLRVLLGDLVQIVEFVGVIAISAGVALAYHAYPLNTPFDLQDYAAAGIIGATGVTALLRRDGFYEFDRLLTSTGVLRAIGSRWMFVVLGLLAFGFALKISENYSRVWLVAWSIGVVAFLFTTRCVAAAITGRLVRDGGAFARRIAIVGTTPAAARFAEEAGAARSGAMVVGVYDAGVGGSDQRAVKCDIRDLDALERAARDGAVDDIVIAALSADKDEMAKLVRRLSALPVSVSLCPSQHWIDHCGGAVTRLGQVNVLSLYRRPLEGWGGVSKIIADYVAAAILLVALAPLMLIIAAAIRMQDRGPAIFSQQRHGFNNSVFRIYKFRTMTVTEDGAKIAQARPGDPRITPLGKLLRRYSLDELPQLFNVVAGQMSLVGPRPHALAHNHQYARLIENYSGRHKVKPGITGWAQVNGYRGETSENELMEERVRFDLAYIDNWSLWFDFKILVLTVLAVAFPKNAV